MTQPKKKAVSLKPRDFNRDLRSLIRSGEKPPHLTSAEFHELDFCNDGILAVKEALASRPFSAVAPRELSRYASRIAFDRMQDSDLIKQLTLCQRLYLDNKIWQPQRTTRWANRK